jgi:hypothetical protein
MSKSEESRHLVVAPKAAAQNRLPSDWQEQVARLSGLEVIGSSFNRVQLRATAEGLNQLKDKFGHVLNIEEAIARKPGS